MSRTYIGPFGRILPVPDGKEPERQLFPVDETRTNMINYQLPPPEQLNFGSDTTPGFTEPTRYNTMSQSRRAHDSTSPIYGERSVQAHHDHLPSVRQLLTPHDKPSIPSPYSTQQTPSADYPPALSSPNQESQDSNPVIHSQRYTQQARVPLLKTAIQLQPPPNATLQRNNYHPIHTSHQPPSSFVGPEVSNVSQYATYPEAPQSIRYHTQVQQNISPPISQTQSVPLMNAALHQQGLQPSTPVQYYQVQSNNYEPSPSSMMSSQHGAQSAANIVKPMPRVIGERDVPGEGPCWFYEDGTHCKKVIEGEAVNAHWGVTKAGKPRKRLAIACTTCREKKIKCDPAEPKCVQCEKFGRECRFTTAFRNQHTTPNSPSYDSQAHTPSISMKAEATEVKFNLADVEVLKTEDSKVSKRRKASPQTDGTSHIQRHASQVCSENYAIKKQWDSTPSLNTPSEENKLGLLSINKKLSRPLQSLTPPLLDDISAKDRILSFEWCKDPFEIDPTLTCYYIDLFFHYANVSYLALFPHKPLLHWLKHPGTKSLDDLMTLYAMLAVGSIFSPSSPEQEREGHLFAMTAEHAVEKSHGNLSLHLIHSRLMLALYHYALGKLQQAWEFAGSAIRVASSLRLHLESKCQSVKDDSVHEYGLSGAALIECRRRTFWLAYMTDRFVALVSGYPLILHNADIYLRLPCEEEIYGEQEHSDAAYFDNGFVDEDLCRLENQPKLGPMAFAVQISSIWGDVFTHIVRTSQQSSERCLRDYEEFYDAIHGKLSFWMQNLPSNLRYSAFNTTAHLLNASVNLYTIYCLTMMVVSRYVRRISGTIDALNSSMNNAISSARQLLRMVQSIVCTTSDKTKNSVGAETQQHSFHLFFSNPLLGYAILSAIDILTAERTTQSESPTVLIETTDCALVAVTQLGRFWASARIQAESIRQRLQDCVKGVTNKNEKSSSISGLRCPLDNPFGTTQDTLYERPNSTNSDRVSC